MMQYTNFGEVITRLNTSGISYLVLRNYDNLLEKEMYMSGHGDVDMLVADSAAVAGVLEAETYSSHGNDGTHYYVVVDGEKVSLDLRHVGDGYYCRKWQEDMLNRRIEQQGFFVMNPIDYFYSLIYHAILQKPSLSEEYRCRLTSMAQGLGIQVPDKTDAVFFVKLMEQYMREKGYTYTYPTDTYVPLHTRYVSNDLVSRDYQLAFGHWCFDTRVAANEWLVKVYHLFRYGKYSYSLN